MSSSLLSLRGCVGVATIALLLGSGAWAQAPDQEPSPPSQPRLRQPTPQSVQQQEDLQASADKIRAETDRKMREMDRRLNRTLRSVCVGC